MVGPDGIEPSTSPLSGVRSSHLSYGPRCLPNSGGAGRVRTGDLLSANQALSQLSYSPFSARAKSPWRRLRESIEASWIQGPRISNPQPLSDSLPYALSGDPVACSPPVPRFYPEDLMAVYGMERLPPTRPRCTLKRFWLSETPSTVSLRKEVIQPQVLLRLPCYDFTPIMDHTLGRCPPCGSACRLLVQSTFVM